MAELVVPPLPVEVYQQKDMRPWRFAQAIRLNRALHLGPKAPEFLALAEERRIHILVRIEVGCYDKAFRSYENISNHELMMVQICHLYETLMYKVICNVRYDVSGTPASFVEALLDGKLDPYKAHDVRPEQSNPDIYADCLKKIKARAENKDYIKYSEDYRCDRCHQSKAIISRAYTRALDEGVNLLIECVNCGNKMRG
jgi:DNA-directed RNA polymerase subunit M/transcription elongation factor TFIIS